MKSIWVTELGAAFPKKPKGIRSVKCVPFSEYNRLRKAVEWALEELTFTNGRANDLATMAGLRWDGEARKWVKKEAK